MDASSERATQHFGSRRSPVICCGGLVGSSQPLASEAGLRVLREGGNAADAAVAVSAALAVLEPTSTGVGGDFFCLFYSAADRSVRALNGSGKSPRRLDAARARADMGLAADYRGAMPSSPEGAHSPHAVTVPGAIAGWLDCIERFGSGRKSVADVLGTAIRLAEDGFPVAPVTAGGWKRSAPALRTRSRNGREVLVEDAGAPGGLRGPNAGELFKRPGLARVLREVVAKGKEGFYSGWVAQAIVDELQEHGGVMEMDDLREHESLFPEAICTEYADKVVWEVRGVVARCSRRGRRAPLGPGGGAAPTETFRFDGCARALPPRPPRSTRPTATASSR